MTTVLDPVQTEVIAALESGALTGGLRPERIDTHISHLFLTPERVYKLKRAVQLNFIDQSTQEARGRLCEQEVRINRRTAPGLYLGVAAVRRDGEGGFSLAGEGEIVDWLVEMHRFRDDDLFDAIAGRGALTPDMAAGAARALAALHRLASPVFEMGHAADYRRTIRELRHTEENAAHEAGVAVADASLELFNALDAELAHVDPLIEARRRAGKTRRGHGDAHLRNITLVDGAPTLFDALEFDERMATIDIVYDFAFLAMDLQHRNLKQAANAAMNAWWDEVGDDETGLAVLPFFMALRAAVRMAVATAASHWSEAQSYRELAMRLLDRKSPVLVAIGGLSGVGKSTIARQLASDLPGPCGARLLRSDVLRKADHDVAEAMPAVAYTPEQRAVVYKILAQHAAEALDAGFSVIADATFQDGGHRQSIAECAGAYDFAGLWLTAELSVRLRRISSREKGASDADENVARAQSEPEITQTDWTLVDASGATDKTLIAARNALIEYRVISS